MDEAAPAPSVHDAGYDDVRSSERYVKISRLGEGTYGVVYLARVRGTDRTVALKKVRMEAWDEGIPPTAMREISVLREIDHPNIVGMEDVFVSYSGNLYLVFELLDFDLRKLMDHRRGTRLPLSLCKAFAYQMLQGIDRCHVHRVIHRDMKPQNILINRGGQLKLADFGLARPFAVPIRRFTHEVVTLWYRAPEILLGTEKYSTAVDLWSVGCIVAETMLGRPLFTGDSEIDQLLRVFQTLGTPTEENWPGVSTMPNYSPAFPNWRQSSLRRRAHDLPEDALSFLEQLLQYNPKKRMTAWDALRHPFLADMTDERSVEIAREEIAIFAQTQVPNGAEAGVAGE